MAELYQAYGDFNDNDMYEEREERPRQQQQRDQREAPVYSPNVPVQQAPPQPQPSAQRQAVPPVKETFSQEYAQVPAVSQQQAYQYKRNTSYSFWDRMALKRSEVIKLAIFALVIVLAIALDRIGTHYLTKYLSDNIFTEFQEFMLRLSYPVIVFIILWIVKAL